jgi:hypothetical protein
MLDKRVLGAFGLLLLASCGGPVKTHAPDGKEAYILDCKGGRYACAQQAGDLCGTRGYSALDQAGRVVPPQVPLGNLPEMMVTCRDTPATVYSGESQPPPSGGETASKLLNQPGGDARAPPQSVGRPSPRY